jgi:ACS family tartrate transporter-like MFS transporter
MAEEKARVRNEKHVSVWKSLIDLRVIALGGIHFAQAGVSVGMAVFVTLIVKQLGHSNMETGWLTAIPFIFGTLGILIWGHISDRMKERKWNLTASCFVMAVGLAMAVPWTGARGGMIRRRAVDAVPPPAVPAGA